MIIYTEKGFGLHEKIQEAGHSLGQGADKVWYSTNDEAVQAIIDGYTLTECKDYALQRVTECGEKLRNRMLRVDALEAASWAEKVREARGFLGVEPKSQEEASVTGVPTLYREAAVREVTVLELAAKVMGKSRATLNMEADIAGIMGKYKDSIRDATTFAEVSDHLRAIGLVT